jgi:hypothetical protein
MELKKIKIKVKRPIKWWIDEKKVELDDIEHAFWTNKETRWKEICKN